MERIADDSAKVLIDIEPPVVRLTLNDPDTLNAIGPRMAEEIRDAEIFNPISPTR